MPADRTGAPADRQQRSTDPVAGSTRLMALAVPGLAPLLASELRSMADVHVTDTGSDGRADVVLFTAGAAALRHVLTSRLAEDMFVEAGRTLRSEGDRAQWVAGRLCRPHPMRRALAARAQMTRPANQRTTFRVIARVMQERSFLRTDLRRQLTDAILRQQPDWRVADPAGIEVWAVEYQPGKIVAGLRVSDSRMRQHAGRDTERGGALRPTVAAAMIQFAGRPHGVLLDPCCGSGTILMEAAEAGWHATGVDIDPDAVRVAGKNAPGAQVRQGDVRHLELAQGSVRACVSNLPFGRQYAVQQDMSQWLRAALSELARVTQPGGRVVLLAPGIPRNVLPTGLRPGHGGLTFALADRAGNVPACSIPIRLLGTKTAIWVYDRQ